MKEEANSHTLSLEIVISHCLNNNIPFYSYRLPETKEITCGIQLSHEAHLFKGFEKHRGEKGFILNPFNSSSWSFPYIIKPDIEFADSLTDKEDINCLLNTRFVTPDRELQTLDSSHDEYIDALKNILIVLNRGTLKKAVFSRTITIPCDALNVVPQLYRAMMQYTEAFVYIAVIPGKCAWMGATPETLLRYNREGFSTMALAGTQSNYKVGEPVRWTPKEMEEQKIVSDFVTGVLEKVFKRNLEIIGPLTVQAGNLYHLCTYFKSDEQLPVQEIDDLIHQLHPTPAVCGYPRKIAMNCIGEMEKHDRKYYTGLVGPLEACGAFNLFVNLRCMELFNDAFKLYVGGGITSSSDPEAEWNETTEKSKTLLNLISKF